MAHQDFTHVVEMVPLSPGDLERVDRTRAVFRGMVEVRNAVPALPSLYPPRRTRIRCVYIMHIPEGYELVRRAPPPPPPPHRTYPYTPGMPSPPLSYPFPGRVARPDVAGPSSAASDRRAEPVAGRPSCPYFYGEDAYGRLSPPGHSRGVGTSRSRPRDPSNGVPPPYSLGIRVIRIDDSEDEDATLRQPPRKVARRESPVPTYTPSAAGTPDDPVDLEDEDEETEDEDPRECSSDSLR